MQLRRIVKSSNDSPRKPATPHANSSKQALPEKVDRASVAPVPEQRSPADGQRPTTERQRSNSVSTPTQPQAARKRTSSGVFQVDDAEPPPKKIELVRSNSDSGKKKPEGSTNGRRKDSEEKTEEIAAQKEKLAAQKEKVAAQIEKLAAHKQRMDAQKEKMAAQKDKMAAQKEKKIVEKFDANAKSKCVSAFKESDSWD
ncbi:hypothetical protein NE865_16588 [Phthorimaea operculella]|nr:hypothetical protein NE865_16588 [Phthorimaea operculella]